MISTFCVATERSLPSAEKRRGPPFPIETVLGAVLTGSLAHGAPQVNQVRGRASLDLRHRQVLHFCQSKAQPMDSAITSKGQATIPKAIREHLGLRPGDRVKFFIHPDGTVVLLPKLPVTALRGMFKSQRPPVTVEQMNDAITAGATSGWSVGRTRKRR